MPRSSLSYVTYHRIATWVHISPIVIFPLFLSFVYSIGGVLLTACCVGNSRTERRAAKQAKRKKEKKDARKGWNEGKQARRKRPRKAQSEQSSSEEEARQQKKKKQAKCASQSDESSSEEEPRKRKKKKKQAKCASTSEESSSEEEARKQKKKKTMEKSSKQVSDAGKQSTPTDTTLPVKAKGDKKQLKLAALPDSTQTVEQLQAWAEAEAGERGIEAAVLDIPGQAAGASTAS